MQRRAFLGVCLLAAVPASVLADRFEFRIKRQNHDKETVVVHAETRLAAEKKLRKDHPNCVILDVRHTKK